MSEPHVQLRPTNRQTTQAMKPTPIRKKPPTLVALEKAAVEYAKLRPWDESNPLAAAATKHARHLARRGER